MLGILLTTLATALGLLIVDLVVPGVDISNFPAALIAAVAIGLVNGFIKPILSLLSLPITFLTLGLFALVINGICFWLASILVPGFSVQGLLGILLGPIVLSLASTFLNKYFAGKGLGTTPATDGATTVQTEGK
ncbi:phage holin family protein [Thermocoleostomius sinensis]|uniref:Phage holin family protein n=1 Tax=Thermocoleostomius sinensis A174 TaxID=2016057 RepID=A0A9E8Z7W8_9CYAN|nr:phage holin family protein [Thermocoleostomius sinensis]WAL58105.1 phage holin family protein [Thermocoleostomius sinensis A174]